MSPMYSILIFILIIVGCVIGYKIIDYKIQEKKAALNTTPTAMKSSVRAPASADTVKIAAPEVGEFSLAAFTTPRESNTVNSFYGSSTLGKLDTTIEEPDFDIYTQQVGPTSGNNYTFNTSLKRPEETGQKSADAINAFIEKKND